jgi:hypothetical protein
MIYLDLVNGVNYSEDEYLVMLSNEECPAVKERAKILVKISKDGLISLYFDVIGESIKYLGLNNYSEVLQKSISNKLQSI